MELWPNLIMAVLNIILMMGTVNLMRWHIFYYYRGVNTIIYIDFLQQKKSKLKELKEKKITKE